MDSLTSLAAALAYAAGIEPPKFAAEKNEALSAYVDQAFAGKKADRILLYCPDAVGYWVQQKYPYMVNSVKSIAELELPLRVVYPPVTPVCFATFFTGAEPKVHGTEVYNKRLITIDTLFDAMIRAGKKCVIHSQGECSMSLIFKERKMDYVIRKTPEEVLASAAETILKDEHDLVIVYNCNYDSLMHLHGPESNEALGELKFNDRSFGFVYDLVKRHWTNHNTLLGFGMDHGCHARYKVKDNGTVSLGDHGADIPVDMEVCHYYRALPAEE